MNLEGFDFDMKENKILKWLLIIQSFTPLFFLLLIKYFDHTLFGLVNKFFKLIFSGNVIDALLKAFCHEKFLQLLLIIVCTVLVIWGVWIYFYFGRVQTAGFTDRAEKISVGSDTTETSVAFFVSYIIPMLLDDITKLKGFICFTIIITMLILLMRNTNLYYQNPILAVIGYKTFEFQFTETNDSSLKGKDYIAITKGKVDESKIIKRKYITDNVFVIYNKN